MSPRDEKLIATPRLEEYFHSEVRTALDRQKVDASPHTEFYLVHLLSQFCRSAQLFSSEKNEETPLAVLYLESLRVNSAEAYRLLKQLADVALYISGFFQDSLNRKAVDVDYYRNMGGSAYHRLHSLSRFGNAGDAFSDTFLELACNFMRFADVLSEISERTHFTSAQDLLKLYERWLSTGSERIRKKLEEMGIAPQTTPKNETHH